MPGMSRVSGGVAPQPLSNQRKEKGYPYAYAGLHCVHRALQRRPPLRRPLPKARATTTFSPLTMSAYVAYLKSLQQAIPDPTPERPADADLKARVQRWFEGLPKFAQDRPFSICEVEAALAMPGRLISPALLALGWSRHRRYDSRGQQNRVWLPPSMNPKQEPPT